jgi:hypothetical protein
VASDSGQLYTLTVTSPGSLGPDGIPAGLGRDSNNNGIPDWVESALGLDPAANNSNDPRLQNIKRQYQYDANDQLVIAPERTYDLDAEGNIKGN